jgi:hypothetical protein
MIGHKLPNKTKSATVAEPKHFHQLNPPKTVPKMPLEGWTSGPGAKPAREAKTKQSPCLDGKLWRQSLHSKCPVTL